MNDNTLFYNYILSPFGQLEIAATNDHLCSIRFVSEHLHKLRVNKIIENTQQQLTEYFDGSRQDFDLPLYNDGTHFQKQVWQQLRCIPYGTTCSYGDIAQKIGRPKAVRAVGAANGRNQIAIIVPCHRVIGANGSLTGYAWGIAVKTALLNHEQQIKHSLKGNNFAN
jgi:methylated-DNA-[protein]-cysteine S-methyltransferase